MLVLEPGAGYVFLYSGTGKTRRFRTRGGCRCPGKMLQDLRRPAQKGGLTQRIETRPAAPQSPGVPDLDGRVDFVLAEAVVPELPSAPLLLREAAAALKPGGRLLLAEHAGHAEHLKF